MSRLVFRDPRMNAHPGWYLRAMGKWYRVIETQFKWLVL